MQGAAARNSMALLLGVAVITMPACSFLSAVAFPRPQNGPRVHSLRSSGAAATQSGAGAWTAAGQEQSSCISGSTLAVAAAVVAMATAASRAGRRSGAAICARAATSEGNEDLCRRQFLASAVGATALSVPQVAFAEQNPNLAGPFTRLPKDAILVEDPNAKEAQENLKLILAFMKQNEKGLQMIKADAQADLGFMFEFGPADNAILKEALYTFDKLFDDRTQPGTRLIGRKLAQARSVIIRDIEFPTNKKGVVLERGPRRIDRIVKTMQRFKEEGEDLLAFLPAQYLPKV